MATGEGVAFEVLIATKPLVFRLLGSIDFTGAGSQLSTAEVIPAIVKDQGGSGTTNQM